MYFTVSLGPITDWRAELKTMVSCMLASPYRECILYGLEMVMIYNDRVGAALPTSLGLV
jgi:hypothetical protein